ncbi:MAG: dephospho-CoA kinase, partial [Candidatus Thiodiazotropha sp.]
LADRVFVVDCDEKLQIDRVAKRDNLNRKQIKQILASQTDRTTRLQSADDVIENNGTVEMLIDATERLHQYYLKLTENK